MDPIYEILNFIASYPIIAFGLMGYWVGYVIRAKGIYKMILLLVFLYYFLPIMVGLNKVYILTLPFLLGSVIGYLGMDRVKYYLSVGFDVVRDLIRR
jgi:uncharacterized membrane protein